MLTAVSTSFLMPSFFSSSTADVALIARWPRKSVRLCLLRRVAAALTNGQAPNQGIIIGMSRYMNASLRSILKRDGCGAEAGVIKDQPTSILPYGYFALNSTSDQRDLGHDQH